MRILKQKMTWLAVAIVLVVLIVFELAMRGSVLGSKSKELPVALVVLDQPAELARPFPSPYELEFSGNGHTRTLTMQR